MRTSEVAELYKKRGATVEPVNGIIKDRHRLRRFSLRGLAACLGELNLTAATHNLRPLFNNHHTPNRNRNRLPGGNKGSVFSRKRHSTTVVHASTSKSDRSAHDVRETPTPRSPRHTAWSGRGCGCRIGLGHSAAVALLERGRAAVDQFPGFLRNALCHLRNLLQRLRHPEAGLS
ncbi:transposase [Saccharopolyspora sp. NPDC000995]